MELKFDTFFKDYTLFLTRNSVVSTSLGNSELGNITRIDNAINNISSYLISDEEELEETKVQLDKARLEFGKPFSQEEELKTKQKRLNEVNRLLDMNEKDNEIFDDENEEVDQSRQVYKNDYER